jgi:phenylacetate-CoA ligase
MPAYLDALKTYKVESLLGYSSALYFVARQALRLGRRDLKMKVVVTNAEPVTALQRRVISEAFQCPVRETYGSAEIVGAGSDCEHGKMHLWPEVGILETLDADCGVADPIPGELICTSLLNSDMPLIRYRMGDCADIESEGTSCACGRSLPTIQSIEGRVDDVLFTRDGRQVGRLDPAFKGTMPIHEAQIIQESLETVRVRYVPAEGFASSSSDAIARAIREHLGPVDVILEAVTRIPREKNGKFRAVVTKVKAHKLHKIPSFVPERPATSLNACR